MAYQNLIVETEDHVALIRLNRPDALNALNSDLVRELADALQEADRNDNIRAIVVTGSEKAFAAGADIKEMAEKTYADMFATNMFGDDFKRITGTRKPVIAAVSGYALGGGCELAMACDFIVCADTARFGQPEINLGIIPGMGGTQRLARLIGRSKAMDMVLTGRFMDAAEAERAGLVSRIFPAAKLIPEALAIARKIAEKSRLSVMAAKECVHRAEETSLDEGILFERRSFAALFSTEDQKEGMGAFMDKREPQFRDR